MRVKAMDLTVEMVKESSYQRPITIEHHYGTFRIWQTYYGTAGGRELPGGTEYTVPVVQLDFHDRKGRLVGEELHYHGLFQLLKLSILDKVRTGTFEFDKGIDLEDITSLWLHHSN